MIKLTYKAWRSESYLATLNGEGFEEVITDLPRSGPQ